MIKAVIFDMDGTTVDTLNSIAYFVNQAMKKYGLDELSVQKVCEFIGNGPKKLIDSSIEYVNGDLKKSDEILTYYLNEYNANYLHLAKPYDGIIKMLEDLKAKGILSAIISNKQDEAVRKISDAFFGDLVIKAAGTKPDVPRKPAPDSLINLMKELGVEKDEVIFVGDTNVDIFTAKNAGVKSIGVLWGFRDEQELRDAKADYIVSNPEEILELIK